MCSRKPIKFPDVEKNNNNNNKKHTGGVRIIRHGRTQHVHTCCTAHNLFFELS